MIYSFPTVCRYSEDMLFFHHFRVALLICKSLKCECTVNVRHQTFASDQMLVNLVQDVRTHFSTMVCNLFVILQKHKSFETQLIFNRIVIKYLIVGNNWQLLLRSTWKYCLKMFCTFRVHWALTKLPHCQFRYLIAISRLLQRIFWKDNRTKSPQIVNTLGRDCFILAFYRDVNSPCSWIDPIISIIMQIASVSVS